MPVWAVTFLTSLALKGLDILLTKKPTCAADLACEARERFKDMNDLDKKKLRHSLVLMFGITEDDL